MRDPANVRLVDAHPKCDGRHHDQIIIRLKPPLYFAALFRLHPAVVGQSLPPGIAQRFRQRLSLCPCPTIDNATLPFARSGKIQDLVARFIFAGKGQMNIWAVKSTKKDNGINIAKKSPRNLLARFGVGRRRKRRQRDIERPTKSAYPQIVRSEIMAPLAHAMRLVHGQQRNPCLRQHPLGPARCQTFRCHIEKLQITSV